MRRACSTYSHLFNSALALVVTLWFVQSAQAQFDGSSLSQLCSGEFSQQSQWLSATTERAIVDPANTLKPVQIVLEAIARRKLLCTNSGALLRIEDKLHSAATLQEWTGIIPDDAKPPKTNLKMRARVASSQLMLSLVSGPTPDLRLNALNKLEKRRESASANLLQIIAEKETDSDVKQSVLSFRSTLLLNDPEVSNRMDAIAAVSANASRRNLVLLTEALSAETDKNVLVAQSRAIQSIELRLFVGDILSTFYSGLSYASVLFLAALGLSIIFGLMGVINLAQGELIMIGAYITWLVQEALQTIAPGMLDYYLLIALPLAFLGSALVGLLMEILVVSRLYARPLMTLLATWAISLLLINSVRVLFGTQNLEFYQPGYVTGGIPLVGDFIMTNNRLFAIGVALAAGLLVLFILRKTLLGMNIAAVTKHRDTSEAMGINTRRVNRLAFALGSGMAGLAGTALSPLYNVNPNMGTNFIIDSFMVVVLGGVGSLLGAVVASLGIGQINVIIEPVYGAVAAKVIVLVLIIAFIQKRPEGLFVSTLRQ